MDTKQLGAFAEYTLRPMVEDLRELLEKLKELNLPLSEALIRKIAYALAIGHFIEQVIQAAMYVIVTGVICHAAVTVLTHHSG